ncbi:MAG: hypothetical protein ACREVJ_01290, partial [Gammaproteobacteria bacterium]
MKQRAAEIVRDRRPNGPRILAMSSGPTSVKRSPLKPSLLYNSTQQPLACGSTLNSMGTITVTGTPTV